jgi:hypothetical protein
MFDKFGQVAERLATHVSRRAFLGRLAKGALVTAGALGSVLTFGGKAQALGFPCSRCPAGTYCCYCNSIQGFFCSTKRARGCGCTRV